MDMNFPRNRSDGLISRHECQEAQEFKDVTLDQVVQLSADAHKKYARQNQPIFEKAHDTSMSVSKRHINHFARAPHVDAATYIMPAPIIPAPRGSFSPAHSNSIMPDLGKPSVNLSRSPIDIAMPVERIRGVNDNDDTADRG